MYVFYNLPKGAQQKLIIVTISKPGGEALVFRGGYHAQVWPLKMDPKLRF